MVYIDAHNYLKRIYHGGGSPYSLFYAMMIKYQARAGVQVVCDGPNSRKYRKEIHSGYKAGRPQGDDPVYWEVYNNCIAMATMFDNVKVIKMTAGEADDYIMYSASANDIVISNDKDLWPLIDKNVTILLNASTKVDEDLVWTKFKALPSHIHLYKALVGDPSDKIPGKRGFGPAAWDKLVYKDREFYTQKFKTSNCDFNPTLMTESACMSYKLARPWVGFTYNVEPTSLDDPLLFCAEKGIVL